MSKRPSHRRPSDVPQPAGDDAIFKRRPSSVKSRRRPDGLWELVHPPCALERGDDLEEAQAMLTAGEVDVAVDEVRWLLEECRDFIEAHTLLGSIALEAGDFRLARGHFGYAFELGRTALPEGGVDGRLAYSLPANQPLLQAAKGLAACLKELNKQKTATLVLNELQSWDKSDPLGAAALLESWTTA